MSDHEILEKAIQRAVDNGWTSELRDYGMYEADSGAWFAAGKGEYGEFIHAEDIPYEIIFNHEFAKALWPEEPSYYLVCLGCEATYNFWEAGKFGDDMPTIKFCNQCGTELVKEIESYSSPWRMHLKNMVIDDAPILYLGETLGITEADVR